MKYRWLFLIALLLPLIFLNNTATVAAPIPDEVNFQTYVYEEGNPPDELVHFLNLEGATNSDYTIHGTMWQPQFWSHVNRGVYGNGTVMSHKDAAGGYEWAHISVPFPTYINGVAENIAFVQFCAEADHPSRTKPTKLQIWADTLIYNGTISWPNSTARQCVGVTFAPIWKESLGLSVLIKYYNGTDKVTLDKAWVRIVP